MNRRLAILARSVVGPGGRIAPAAGRDVQPAAPAVAFALVSERAAFDALEPEWNDLFRRAGRDTQLFQTFNWNWHWANHYLAAAPGDGKRRALAIVTARRNGRLVMLWPLVAERVAGLQVLRWMGEPVSQYGDVLAEAAPDTPRDHAAGLAVLVTRWAPMSSHLRKVRADATVAPLLRELGRAPDGASPRRRFSISPARRTSPPTSSATAPRRARTAAA